MGTPGDKPHLEKGTNTDIAFVFACPGWCEEFHSRPAAGDTGRNLEILLGILQKWEVPGIPTRRQLTITNAWDGVLYEEKDNGQTLPDDDWITEPGNLKRLKDEIGHIRRWIVCAGTSAHSAGDALMTVGLPSSGCKIVKILHLGPQGLNNPHTGISTDIFGRPITPEKVKKSYIRNRLRLEVVAARMLRKMGLNQYIPRDPEWV
jgi:hypothetical protein